MADAIEKFLARAPKADVKTLLDIMENIRLGNLSGLQIKKLVGTESIFRVKKGSFRIIYKKIGEKYSVLEVTRRSEKTYKDF